MYRDFTGTSLRDLGINIDSDDEEELRRIKTKVKNPPNHCIPLEDIVSMSIFEYNPAVELQPVDVKKKDKKKKKHSRELEEEEEMQASQNTIGYVLEINYKALRDHHHLKDDKKCIDTYHRLGLKFNKEETRNQWQTYINSIKEKLQIKFFVAKYGNLKI